MIDGVKISFFSESIESDFKRLGIDIDTPLNEVTGEIRFPKYAKYLNLDFKISESKRIEITGSLHKYWKGDNYSDFTFNGLCDCIADLSCKFNFDGHNATLHNLEFGVNVSPLFNPFEFCKRVIAYKNESFSKFRTNGKNKIHIGFEATQQQYSLKIYDKGKQYEKIENILRYEVKVSKMQYLKSVGVSVLSDLLDIEKITALGTILNETFAELIICEDVTTSELSMNENRIFAMCSNPKEWEKFNRKERFKRKKQFNDILTAKGKTNQKETTARLIRDKWQMLLAINNPKSGDVLTDLSNTEKGRFNRLDIPLICPPLQTTGERICKSCGRDISNQKKGSVFCSERMFGKVAKGCRNKDSNPRNNLLYREQKKYGGFVLFDVNRFLK